jgi:primary-amine oxidase
MDRRSLRPALAAVSSAVLVSALLVSGGALAQPSAALIEARHRMLDADINTLTFRSMAMLFDTLQVENEGQPEPLAERPAALDFTYTFDGETVPAEDFLERTYTNALLIIKDDAVVFERYLNNSNARSHFISMSMAKSLTSILIGMAIEDGHLSIDDAIVDYVPELAGTGYDDVTIRQALLMRSGVDWNERYDFGRESPMQRLHDAAVVENRMRFADAALELGRAHPPGESFNYSTVETAVLGWVLERAVGRPMNEYMTERWWKSAGMQSHAFWIMDGPPGVGRAINGMGFNAVARDFARIGLMMLNEGRANGRQLVSSEWVTESTTPDGTEPIAPGASRGYQYQWWTLTDSDAYTALGLQGQYLYIDPATRTVVVKLSYFPPGEQRADAETEAFLRAVSAWTPGAAGGSGDAASVEDTAGETQAQGSGSATHPLDALTPDELRRTVDVLRTSGRIDADAAFATLDLEENDKEAVRAWRQGEPFARRAFAVVMQRGRVYEGVVDVGRGEVESWREVEGAQPRVLLAETNVNDVLWSSSDWQDAMTRRGYEDGEHVFCAPLTPGPALPAELAGRRILYSSCFDITDEHALAFGRPIEGLMAVVDVGNREVLSVVDLGVVPLPANAASLTYERSARYRPPARPVAIVTPEGSNVRISGSQVRWDNWSFHLRVDQRVGPVISLVRYDDEGAERDVLYQLAVSEMFVPYMDPASTWSWRAYMDVGEYGFGLLASSLRPGVDCPASAHLLDRTIAADDGEPIVLANSVCIFERPTGGPLWRHAGEGAHEGAANVELVVRMAPVIGNYDYFIDYVFDRAGDIEVRVGATGIDAVKAVAAESMLDPTAAADTAYGTLIAKGLVGINHDHYISFRVDVDVDGARNRAVFDRVTRETLPLDNPRRSLWTVTAEPVTAAGPLPHALHDGFLRIESGERTNALGNPTSFQLYPGHTAASVLDPEDPIQARAEWSRHPVWLSRHAPGERYASGAYPNQNAEVDGLPKWTDAQQDIDGEDLVLWYNVGFRHITRAEDWPAMPAVWHSFRLRPFNFFDASAAMDVPR